MAGSAIIEDGQPLDRSDVVNALREVDGVEDSESASLLIFFRLRELRVHTVTVRNEMTCQPTQGGH